jgi:hypothetical protein
LSNDKKLTFGIGLPPGMPAPQPLEAALNTAHQPVYPLLKVTFVEAKKKQSYEASIDVAPSIYKLLTEAFRGDETVLFLDINNPLPLGVFVSDMMDCFRLLSKMGLMSPFTTWLTVARERISQVLANQKGEKPKASASATDAMMRAAQMLSAAGLLQEVEANASIIGIARDVIQSGKKDIDTAIYRVAMGVYWARPMSGQSLLQSLEDPTKIYLNLTSNPEIRAKFKDAVETMESRGGPARQEFVRAFVCFLIGAYVCHKLLSVPVKST